MPVAVLHRGSFYYYPDYENPVNPPGGISFGDGYEYDTEQCVLEFNIDPATIDTSSAVTLDFELHYASVGTKYIRRWKNAYPTTEGEMAAATALDDATNQVTWTESGSASVSLDVRNLIDDMVTAGQTTVLLGIPDTIPHVNGVMVNDGTTPTLTYNVVAPWLGEDWEAYPIDTPISDIAGWTTSPFTNLAVVEHLGSKRGGVLETFSGTEWFERTLDVAGTIYYDWHTESFNEYIRVSLDGVIINTHQGPGSGSDSIVVDAGDVIRFEMTSDLGAVYVDNLSYSAPGISGTAELSVDISLTSIGRAETNVAASSLALAPITLTSEVMADLVGIVGNTSLLLDLITLESTASGMSRGMFQGVITLSLDSTEGKVHVSGSTGSGESSLIVIDLLSNNHLTEGTATLYLEDILVSGEIPQGGEPRFGTLSQVITIFIGEAFAAPRRFGELTADPIIITLYARIAEAPPADADSPFLDSNIPLFLGQQNATFRGGP